MSPLIDLLHASPAAFIAMATVLGLIIGSFLNVVIHRLPIMMEREWRAQCDEMLAATGTSPSPQPAAPAERFDLLFPRSRCPHCGHAIRAVENIPVLSYLWLKGRCAGCGKAISVRYPVVEAVTGLLSGIVAWHFGFGWEAAAALLLTWALIALSVIDFDHQLLPDAITLPFLWAGLALSMFNVFTTPEASILGALAGYLSLWSVYILFKLVTGKEGMGHGDFKLLALLGAWMGWKALPVVILFSSVVGALVGIALIVLRGRDKNIPIPFGPYLAAAGWLTLLWGDAILNSYLKMISPAT